MTKHFTLLSGFIMSGVAFAEGPAAPQGLQSLGPFVPLILMFGIFYFLLIRPQQKKAKQQQVFLKELKKGDRVVTQAGLIGTIKTLSDQLVTLEVDTDVCIKFLRSQILESADSLKTPTKA